MASVDRRKTGEGTRYDVRYRLSSGEQRKRSFKTRRDAERFAHTVEADRLRGVLLDPSLGKITFGEWTKAWLAENSQVKRPTTHARDRIVVSSHLLPALGTRKLNAIRPRDVQLVVDAMTGAGLASTTVRTDYGVLRAVLNAAVQAELLTRSPCRGIRLPVAGRLREIHYLDAAEIGRLAGATPVEYRPMVYLAGVLGLRWSEVIGLRVGRVDIASRTVEVTETLAEVEGLVLRADVKAAASRRVLDVPPFLVAMLAEHLLARGLGSDPDALVFVSPDGGPVRGSNFRVRVWKPATEAAKVEGVTFHHLRHSAVGLLVDSGAHPAVIQRRMGHASVRTTFDVYGNVMRSTDDAATSHLNDLFRPTRSVEVVHD